MTTMNLQAFENWMKENPLHEGDEIDLVVTFFGGSVDINAMTIRIIAKRSLEDPLSVFDITANHGHSLAVPASGKTVFEFASDDLEVGTFDTQFFVLRNAKWIRSDPFKVEVQKAVLRSSEL